MVITISIPGVFKLCFFLEEKGFHTEMEHGYCLTTKTSYTFNKLSFTYLKKIKHRGKS